MGDDFFNLNLPLIAMSLFTELEPDASEQPETIELSPDDYTVEDESALKLPMPNESDID